MPDFPTGIVTFFFSDVEGSTRLVRELGDDRWADLLQTHRELIRTALAEHDGREVGTQGDSLFAVFARAGDACAAAIDAQRALESTDWPPDSRIRVRLGLHSGEAVAHGNNYVGKEVHRASRICDAGHGGQIVVSERTAALLRGDVPGDVTITRLGEHRLKDMGDAEPLFQLTAPGLPSAFARLRSLSAPSNLPAARSSFVGRKKELERVTRLLEEQRLVSLTGIGGSGKTRIAIEVGSRELSRFSEGVFFVDLAPLSDGGLVAEAFATTCAPMIGDILRGDYGGSVEERLVAALKERACLLIVDNCEHLIDAVADLLDRILLDCPKMSLLATSREALGIEGEQIVPIPSLTVPAGGGDARAAESTEAVQLFLERAQSVKPEFALASDNLAVVAEICRRLDGIPLAIELAATQVVHLSVRDIAGRLEDRFRLLAGGRRRIQRQQTLSAALDWSHDLLSDDERTMLRRLAVLAGSFTLEAAEAITATGAAAVSLLGALVSKSLVVAREDASGQSRYQLLETVRMYAADKLAEAGEAEALRNRHREWYVDWLEAIPLERLNASPPAVFAVAKEIDNFRAAADWSMARDEAEYLARLGIHLRPYWDGAAYREGYQWLTTALDAGERLPRVMQLRCHASLTAIVGNSLNREEGSKHATAAIELAAGQAPDQFLVIAYGSRGFMTSILASAPGVPESHAADARADCRKAIELARGGLHREWLIRAKALCAMAEMTLGDHAEAAKQNVEILEMIRNDDEPHALLDQSLGGIAVANHLLGHTDVALSAAMEFLALTNMRTAHSAYAALVRAEVTPALFAAGHEEIACETLRDHFGRLASVGIPLTENHALGIAAVVEHLRGRTERAARLLAASRRLGGAQGSEIPFRTPASVSFYRHYLPIVRAALDRDTARRARDEGQAMSVDEALAYAREGLE